MKFDWLSLSISVMKWLRIASEKKNPLLCAYVLVTLHPFGCHFLM